MAFEPRTRRDADLTELPEAISEQLIACRIAIEKSNSTDITKTTATTKDIIGIIFALGAGLIALFGLYSSLTSDINTIKSDVALFKQSSTLSLEEKDKRIILIEDRMDKLVVKIDSMNDTMIKIYNRLKP